MLYLAFRDAEVIQIETNVAATDPHGLHIQRTGQATWTLQRGAQVALTISVQEPADGSQRPAV